MLCDVHGKIPEGLVSLTVYTLQPTDCSGWTDEDGTIIRKISNYLFSTRFGYHTKTDCSFTVVAWRRRRLVCSAFIVTPALQIQPHKRHVTTDPLLVCPTYRRVSHIIALSEKVVNQAEELYYTATIHRYNIQWITPIETQDIFILAIHRKGI